MKFRAFGPAALGGKRHAALAAARAQDLAGRPASIGERYNCGGGGEELTIY